MTAAGIIYSIARDCSRGQLKGCGCRNSTHSGTIYGNASFPVHCLDNLVYAEKVAAEFLQSLELESKDSTAAINLHNFVVGKEVSCYKGSIVHTLKIKQCIAVGLENFKVDNLKLRVSIGFSVRNLPNIVQNIIFPLHQKPTHFYSS